MNTPPTGNRKQETPSGLPIMPMPQSLPITTPAGVPGGQAPVGQVPLAQGGVEDRTLVDTTDADALLANAQKRKQIEDDLRRMGMSPLEVQRLLNADGRSFDPTANELPVTSASGRGANMPLPVLPASPPPRKAKPAGGNMQSMQALAAELMAQKAAAQVQAVREVTLDLPPFRESSSQEARQAEPLLRDAAMLRRREKFQDAEIKAREALQYVPKDAAALELLGDILQGVARVEEAMAVYKRALEADPKRSSAERKYGELLVLQQNWSANDPEAMETNSKWLALVLSIILPGLGQFHNREIGKGVFFLIMDVVCVYLLAYSPYGFGGQHRLTTSLIVCGVLTLVVYVVALVDTYKTAQSNSGGHGGFGWNI